MTPALSLRNLSKTYPGGVTALAGIDLDVGDGEFFALLGPNGAGKSTTIGIISSLINRSGGSVHIYGHDLAQEPEEVKPLLGLVPQEFNFNVFEPIEEILVNQAGYYGVERAEAFDRAGHYLQQLGLWEKRRVMARELSGGMKRRLMIARALVHRPRLLILDEPTAGVDIEIRYSMWEYLRKLNQDGTTIILTTHYLEEAETLCKHIAIIDEGHIVANTSMRQLLSQLTQETIVIDTAAPVNELPVLEGYPITRIDETTLEAVVDRGKGLNDLFAALDAASIEVASMRNKSNRLEQLFMCLVGNSRKPGKQP